MRSNGCRLDRVCKMPPAALPGATRRREARGGRVAGFALRPAPTRSGWGAPRASSDFRGINGAPLRATPHLFHGSLDPLSTRKAGRRTTSQAARGGVFSTWPCLPPCLPFSKRAVGQFLAALPKWSRAAGGKLRFSFDGWPTTSRRRGVSASRTRCFTQNEQPTGQRYVTKTARISYLYCVSYLY